MLVGSSGVLTCMQQVQRDHGDFVVPAVRAEDATLTFVGMRVVRSTVRESQVRTQTSAASSDRFAGCFDRQTPPS